MTRSRGLFSLITVVAAGLVVAVSHGQSRAESNFVIQRVGLPAIDQDPIFDVSHTPASPETIHRTELRRAIEDQRTIASAPYVPGRLFVRVKDDASSADRLDAIRSASATAAIAERPSYANFDIVRLDAAEDPEAAAAALRSRQEVEYAQPAYRVHTMFVPNDPMYLPSTRFTPGQWNLTMIGLEKAWDIQPSAGSKIVVAGLDTGMAYMNA